MIRINGQPLQLVEPAILRYKIYEPILMLGEDNFSSIDIRVRVSGGGHTSQIYAIRQAIGKAAVAYWMKYWDASHALSLKKSLVDYDRTLVIADPRRMEPKKFGGGGARARRQKRCVLIYTCPILQTNSLPVTDKRLSTLVSWVRLCSLPCRMFINMLNTHGAKTTLIAFNASMRSWHWRNPSRDASPGIS